jgi:hypothetical protein
MFRITIHIRKKYCKPILGRYKLYATTQVVSRESQVLKQSSDFRLTIYDSTAQECDATKV